jgi:hypothetical protein
MPEYMPYGEYGGWPLRDLPVWYIKEQCERISRLPKADRDPYMLQCMIVAVNSLATDRLYKAHKWCYKQHASKWFD